MLTITQIRPGVIQPRATEIRSVVLIASDAGTSGQQGRRGLMGSPRSQRAQPRPDEVGPSFLPHKDFLLAVQYSLLLTGWV